MLEKESKADFTFVIPNTRWHRGGEGRYWNHIPYPEGILTAVLRKNGFKGKFNTKCICLVIIVHKIIYY